MTNNDYLEHFKNMDRLVLKFLITFILWPVITFFIMELATRLGFGKFGSFFIAMPFFIYFAVQCVIAKEKYLRILCPRCGQSFFPFFKLNPFRRVCSYCGLKNEKKIEE